MDFGVSDDCCRLINERQDLTDLYKRFIVPVVGWWWFYAMAFCLMLFSAEAMTGRQALRLDDSAIFECRTILSQLGFWQIPAERFNLGITLLRLARDALCGLATGRRARELPNGSR